MKKNTYKIFRNALASRVECHGLIGNTCRYQNGILTLNIDVNEELLEYWDIHALGEGNTTLAIKVLLSGVYIGCEFGNRGWVWARINYSSDDASTHSTSSQSLSLRCIADSWAEFGICEILPDELRDVLDRSLSNSGDDCTVEVVSIHEILEEPDALCFIERNRSSKSKATMIDNVMVESGPRSA